MEPEAKLASLRTAFLIQMQSRSMLLQSIFGFFYELNNRSANSLIALSGGSSNILRSTPVIYKY